MRQARPAGRGDGQSSTRMGAYSPSPACLHLYGLASRKQKKIRIPGAGRPGRKGKEINRGYGRCIDTCPRHRPLPAPEATHIRHPARTGKLGAS